MNEANEIHISSHKWGASTTIKTFKKSETFLINFYDLFRISWLIKNDEWAWPGPTVTFFNGLFLRKYEI